MNNMHERTPTIVLSVGGSLLVPPGGISTSFIHELRSIVAYLLEKKLQVAMVIGGGSTSRSYHAVCSSFSHINDRDIDWIGIRSIALNAELLRAIFSDLPIHPEVVTDPHSLSSVTSPLVIVAAWEPGHSSDYNAVVTAELLHASELINFSNIDYVYDADPSRYEHAQPLSSLTWDEYMELIPNEWTPNLSTPFDPVASRRASSLGISVTILGASTLNLKCYLQGDSFQGTRIIPTTL